MGQKLRRSAMVLSVCAVESNRPIFGAKRNVERELDLGILRWGPTMAVQLQFGVHIYKLISRWFRAVESV